MGSRAALVLGVAIAWLGAACRADAGQPPGPQMLVAEVSLAPLMVLLSGLGGAYAIRRALHPEAPRRVVLTGGGTALAVLVSGADQGIAFAVTVAFGLLALGRAVAMLRWGWAIPTGGDPPPHLRRASRPRLLLAGGSLAVAALALVGMAAAFLGYWPGGEGPRLQELRQFVAYQLASAREAQARTGQPRFPPITATRREASQCPIRLPRAAETVYAADGRSFTVLVPPRVRFPFFPYNYLTSQPAYRADASGRIRSAPVHDALTPCPPDAPVVFEVGEEEVTRMQRLLPGFAPCP